MANAKIKLDVTGLPAFSAAIEENVRLRQGLWDAWAALGFDTDGDDGPGALIAGMGLEWFIQMVVDDAADVRKQWEEDFDAEATRAEVAEAKLARVEALAGVWERDSSLFDSTRRDTCCADARDDERVDVVQALRAALKGGES